MPPESELKPAGEAPAHAPAAESNSTGPTDEKSGETK
jgi:hypothetical protein